MSKYSNSNVEFQPIALETLTPVPSDIDIAQEQMKHAKRIMQIAEELGILPDELELYGNYKAKVKLEILERLKDSISSTFMLWFQ